MECSLAAIKSGLAAVFVPNFESKKVAGIQVAVTVIAAGAAAIACKRVDGLVKHICRAVLALAAAYTVALAIFAYRHFKPAAEQNGAPARLAADVPPAV